MIISSDICEHCEKTKKIFVNIFDTPLHVLIYYVMQNDTPMQDILGCECDSNERYTDEQIYDINSHFFLIWYASRENEIVSPRSPLDYC